MESPLAQRERKLAMKTSNTINATDNATDNIRSYDPRHSLNNLSVSARKSSETLIGRYLDLYNPMIYDEGNTPEMDLGDVVPTTHFAYRVIFRDDYTAFAFVNFIDDDGNLSDTYVFEFRDVEKAMDALFPVV